MLINPVSAVVTRECVPLDRGLEADENPLRASWIPLAIADPLLFQATTTYAALHRGLLCGVQGHVESLARKARTIEMIIEQLHEADQRITDSTIGAIAMMASIEVSIYNVLQSKFSSWLVPPLRSQKLTVSHPCRELKGTCKRLKYTKQPSAR